MQLRDFAQQLLYGDDLADKLIHPASFEDETPGHALIEAPRAPGRPRNLKFETNKAKKHGYRLKQLERAENRAHLLHHLANHELLAIELMALTLLRFPDAPASFRRSIAASILEEQKHLRLYRSRMRKLGYDFGDLPVNDFFWKHLRDMQSPADYAVRMGLTFEQANLDYASHYREAFAKIGDRATAAVLEIVLQDEIGHVKNGVVWFDRLRKGEASQWHAYCDALPENLSPVRARGLGYNAEARRLAGISAEFIRKLEVFAYSKGRPPSVFYFYPACEDDIARPGSVPSAAVRDLTHDLATLPLFLAGHEDLVLLPADVPLPNMDWLRGLRSAGYAIPEFVHNLPPDRKLGDLLPWGWCPTVRKTFAQALHNVVGHRGEALRAQNNDEHDAIFARDFGLTVLQEYLNEHGDAELCPPEESGIRCRSLPEIRAALRGFAAPLIVKAAYSASGRRRVILHDDTLRPQDERTLEKLLAHSRSVIVEPFFERVLDLSAHVSIESEQESFRIVEHGITRLWNDERGSYLGTFCGSILDDLDDDLRRYVAGEKRGRHGALSRLTEAARHAGRRLGEAGYRGPAGIDAFVYRKENRLRLRPIVEINPRYTMGRTALAASRRVRRHRTSLWTFVHPEDAGRAGEDVRLVDGLIDHGVLVAGDRRAVRQRCPVLIVADDVAACRNLLSSITRK